MRRTKIVRQKISSPTDHQKVSSSPLTTLIAQEYQRKVLRLFVRLPATIRLDSPPRDEHVAFVRDISSHGIFFYSDFKPMPSERIAFVLQYRSYKGKANLRLSGSVVRVEQATPSRAIGIGVEFDCEHEEIPRVLRRAPLFETHAEKPTPIAKNTEGMREVFIQERGSRTPLCTQNYPAKQLPKIGAKFSVGSRNFVVMEKEHLVLKRDNKAVRGVLLIVEDFDALSW